MKRQRRGDHLGVGAAVEASKFEGATMTIPSKKAKGRSAAAKVKQEAAAIKVEEARIDSVGDDDQFGFLAAAEENYRWGSVWLDEQMSWGSNWLPIWDVEFMSEAHYGLFSDHVVCDDDDIWGLRTSIKEITIPTNERDPQLR